MTKKMFKTKTKRLTETTITINQTPSYILTWTKIPPKLTISKLLDINPKFKKVGSKNLKENVFSILIYPTKEWSFI